MPVAFVGEIVKSKSDTAHNMVRTCFTFAAGEHKRQLKYSSNEHTCYRHAQGAHFPISGEAHDVETKRDKSVDQQH